MNIYTLEVGPIDTNCYIVEDKSSKKALIIDPGEEAEKILGFIKEHQIIPVYIAITHGHFDHIGANKKLKEAFKIPLLMHESDLFGLALSDSPRPDRFVKENDRFEVGSLKFAVLHTPGHTPGGISLYFEKEKTIFTGDTLFLGTWGRTDLPYSDEKDMAASLKKLLALPPETKVYPGHGRPTMIADERKSHNET